MQTTYRFKLIRTPEQCDLMGSWLGMLRGVVNYNIADRIDSYSQGFLQGDFCFVGSKAEASPLTCSVVRSASNGEPWKEDQPSLRRGKGDKPFNPRRSAYEVQASSLKVLKQSRPWYQSVNTDVMQQALRHLDTAFNRFFKEQSQFPRFKSRYKFNSFEFKPGTVRISGNHIILPSLGDMRFFNSKDIPEITGDKQQEISLPLGGEPGNQTRKGEQRDCLVQLSLFDYLSGNLLLYRFAVRKGGCQSHTVTSSKDF